MDESSSIRQMVAFTLKNTGYTVVEAVDGMDALQKIKTSTIHLIITDQNMPRLDGIGLIRAIRALPTHKTTPILMLTTEASESMKTQGRMAGATGWLVKPFDPQKLIDVVRKVLP